MNSVLGRTSLFATLTAFLAVMVIAVIGTTTAQACIPEDGNCPPRAAPAPAPKTYVAWADLDGRPVAKKYPKDKNGKSLRVKNFVHAGDRVYIHCQAYAKDGSGLYDLVSHRAKPRLKGSKLFVPDRYVHTGHTGRFLKAC